MSIVDKDIPSLFMPYASERLRKLKNENTNFVHYTSASVAMQILDKREVWMRNALLMNDFMEVQHGQNCLSISWSDPDVGGRLRTLLDRLEVGLSEKVGAMVNQNSDERRLQSYLTSVSEHGSCVLGEEEQYGRLSMWRAYGGETNVAIVLHNKALTSDNSKLPAWSSPVLYSDPISFKQHFLDMVIGLEREFQILEQIGANKVANQLNKAFHYAILSTKHPGFREEKEWRIIHSPSLTQGQKLDCNIEVVQGVPQKVFKIPFGKSEGDGKSNSNIGELISKIIVGPTPYPFPIYEALVQKLESVGVENAKDKVITSDIPLKK